MATTPPARSLKTTVKPLVTHHPLEGEVFEVEPQITPGPILVDAALNGGSTTNVMPTWTHVPFTGIVSGTAATIDGSGNLNFNVQGEGYVSLALDVQLDDANITNPAGYNVYMMWQFGGVRTFFAQWNFPPNVNNGWQIGAAGIIPITNQPLSISIGTDYSPTQTLYFWGGDFQLTPPQTPFPDFAASGLPLPAAATGTPANFFPISTAVAPLSVAGVVQPQYASGSATSPAANGYFTKFTTTFPSPTVVFSNVLTVPTGSYSTGWTSTLPPQTPSTICVHATGIALAEADAEENDLAIPPPEQLPPRNGARSRGRPRKET
jgi:hypothetical protein